MSELLARLYAEGAFDPSLAHYELAASHVPLGRLGFNPAPEELLIDAVSRTDGLSLIVGASGSGKSSLIAYCAELLTDLRREDRQYLPLLVPVAAHRKDAVQLASFGRIAVASLLAAFPLDKDRRQKLDQMTAASVTKQLPSTDFNAKLALRNAGPEFGVTLRGEVLSLSAPGALDHDPYGGLDELAHLLRGLKRELVVIVEDTDAWALEADRGREAARDFFAAVLAPLQAPAFAVVVAAQTQWSDVEALAALSERAVARIDIPTYETQAREVVEQIVRRRIEWALGDGERHNVGDVLDEEAVTLLAARLRDTGACVAP